MTPDPAGRRPLKSRGLPFFQKLAAALAAKGVSPNTISFLSVICAFVAAIKLAETPHEEGLQLVGCWFFAAICIQLRLAANMLDGMVAVEGKRGGPTGDLWNEVPDRVADTAILIGAGFAAGGEPLFGFVAALVAMFVAYIRALGASLGAGQCFLGPQGKPHRMAVLTVACLINLVMALVPGLEEVIAYRFPPAIFLALWIVILGGAITAWRRLAFIARYLRSRKA